MIQKKEKKETGRRKQREDTGTGDTQDIPLLGSVLRCTASNGLLYSIGVYGNIEAIQGIRSGCSGSGMPLLVLWFWLWNLNKYKGFPVCSCFDSVQESGRKLA